MRSELTSLDFSASFNRRRVQICSCSSWICSMLRPHNSQHCANIVTFSPGYRFFCSVSGCFCTFLELYRCNIFFTKNNCIAQSPDLCIWAARRASRSQGPWQATCGAQHVAMTFLFATGEWPWKPGASWQAVELPPTCHTVSSSSSSSSLIMLHAAHHIWCVQKFIQ